MSDQPIPRLSAATRDILRRTPVSAISTILTRHGLPRMFMSGVRKVGAELPAMVGQAFTLRHIPARPDLDTLESFSTDDALQRLALEACPEDFVLVVDARGDASIACAGDTFVGRLRARGCAGIVTDGGLRDADAIRALEFPAFFAAPASPPTFIGHHPTDMNVPIGCGGVPVFPGDVVCGDGDGVIVIPLHLADQVAEEAREIVEYDEFVDEQLAAGRSLIGLYPATPASRAEYAAWRAARSTGG
jgi:regulator of RNase E activity RraA